MDTQELLQQYDGDMYLRISAAPRSQMGMVVYPVK